MWGGGVTLQKFQPLATRALERRENEEGPKRPEAGADCSDPAAWEESEILQAQTKMRRINCVVLVEIDRIWPEDPGEAWIFYLKKKKSKTNKMLFFFFFKLPYLVKIFKQ